MNKRISVIICTYNPRADFLQRVLDSLRGQTLAKTEWELLLVDNNSKEPLEGKWDLSWHPEGHIVVEKTQGLTPSRLRGIRETRGELVVFVDDDNILDLKYLEVAARIAAERPFLGVWGGQILAENDVVVPAEMRPMQGYLTICPLERDYWSNTRECVAALPFGAGICLRRVVAEDYARLLSTDGRRMRLGRTGQALGGCEDFDMACTAIDRGLGIGRFKDLIITHLIPPQRLTWEYLEKAVVGGDSSDLVLQFLRGQSVPRYVPRREKIKFWLDYWATTPSYRRLMVWKEKARQKGLAMIAALEAEGADKSA